jgi:hypothetical protein
MRWNGEQRMKSLRGLYGTRVDYRFSDHLSACLYLPQCFNWKCTWAIYPVDEEKLRTFERRILRRIYDPTCENGVWRIKYNDGLYSLYEGLDIVRVIQVARIRWLGHLVRMEENSPCKKITFSQPEGSRKKGKPKLRWFDSVLKYVKLLKVETWWKKARDRNIWRRIIKEANVHTDCRVRGRRRICLIINVSDHLRFHTELTYLSSTINTCVVHK